MNALEVAKLHAQSTLAAYKLHIAEHGQPTPFYDIKVPTNIRYRPENKLARYDTTFHHNRTDIDVCCQIGEEKGRVSAILAREREENEAQMRMQVQEWFEQQRINRGERAEYKVEVQRDAEIFLADLERMRQIDVVRKQALLEQAIIQRQDENWPISLPFDSKRQEQLQLQFEQDFGLINRADTSSHYPDSLEDLDPMPEPAPIPSHPMQIHNPPAIPKRIVQNPQVTPLDTNVRLPEARRISRMDTERTQKDAISLNGEDNISHRVNIIPPIIQHSPVLSSVGTDSDSLTTIMSLTLTESSGPVHSLTTTPSSQFTPSSLTSISRQSNSLSPNDSNDPFFLLHRAPEHMQSISPSELSDNTPRSKPSGTSGSNTPKNRFTTSTGSLTSLPLTGYSDIRIEGDTYTGEMEHRSITSDDEYRLQQDLDRWIRNRQ